MASQVIQIKASVAEALRAARQPGESFTQVITRLLGLAGYSLAAASVPRETRPSKYAGLWALELGKSARLPWRGMRHPRTGAFDNAKQSAVYMAVSRFEKQSGYEFQRRDDGIGLVVTRIR